MTSIEMNFRSLHDLNRDTILHDVRFNLQNVNRESCIMSIEMTVIDVE